MFQHDQQLKDRIYRQVVAEREMVDGLPYHQPGHQPRRQMRMIRTAVAGIAAVAITWWLLAHLLAVAAVIGVLAFMAGGRR